MFILPCISILIEYLVLPVIYNLWELIGKWFIFWALGVRLFTAGLRQVINPKFTAEIILDIKEKQSYSIIRELGFTNICLGLIGIISLFVPPWRIVSAFSGGLFLGLAGFHHFLNKPKTINEKFAMISNLVISCLMIIYILFATGVF